MASGLLTTYLGEGLIADRPASPDIGSGVIAFYYATDTNQMSAYADGAWIENVFGAAGGDLVSTNNLSDLASAATARQNIGVEIGVDVQAFDATLLPAEWVPNFTADGDLYIAAVEAMTISQGNAKIGTGTLTFEKSTTAAPGTFSSTTLPATLQAGAWLKVVAVSVVDFVATHLVRTA